jgi:hypothetical protein
MTKVDVSKRTNNRTLVVITLDELEAFEGAQIVVRVNKLVFDAPASLIDPTDVPTHRKDNVAYVELEANDGSLCVLSGNGREDGDDQWGETHPNYFALSTTLAAADNALERRIQYTE